MVDHYLDISKQDLTRDNASGATSFTDEDVTVEAGTTIRHIRDPFALVQTEPQVSTSRDVAIWELRGQVERSNIEARWRRIPEARRRTVDREIARKQRTRALPVTHDCPACDRTGWIADHDGNQSSCPVCRPGARS